MKNIILKRVFYVIASSVLIPISIFFLICLYGLIGGEAQRISASFGMMHLMFGTVFGIIPYNIIGIIIVVTTPVNEDKNENLIKESEPKTKLEKLKEKVEWIKKKKFVILWTLLFIIFSSYFVVLMNTQAKKEQKQELQKETMNQLTKEGISDKIIETLKKEEKKYGLKNGSYFKSFEIKEDSIEEALDYTEVKIVVNENSENDIDKYITISCNEKMNSDYTKQDLQIIKIQIPDKIRNEMKKLQK